MIIEAQASKVRHSPFPDLSDFVRITQASIFHDFVKPLVPTMLLSLT